MQDRALNSMIVAEGFEVLIDRDRLMKRVSELATQISADYQGRRPVLVVVLKGSFIFAADLVRQLEIDHMIDFIAIGSYGSSQRSSGAVRLIKDLNHNIDGQDVIIVEDIVDSGLTLGYIYASFLARRPKSLEVVALLDKSWNKKTDLTMKYIGFEIPDRFVVGYGLDLDERYRGLPFVAYPREDEEIL
jgi:hypoxanthine phosphoribosyltransferase